MAYEDFKDVTRGTTSDKILHDKAFNIAKNPEVMSNEESLELYLINSSNYTN